MAFTTDSFVDAYLAFRALANFTALAPLRTVFEAILAEEGGPELLQRVRRQLADQMRPSFTQTDEPIDEELFAMFSARTSYGYR